MSQTRVEHNSSMKNHAEQATARTRNQQKPAANTKSPQKTEAIKVSLSHERIAARAYEIWQLGSHQPNQELRNWLEAEDQLRREAGGDGL
jgi:hypothetical protein